MPISQVRLFSVAFIVLLMPTSLYGCKKEHSCEGCANSHKNKPPIAVAGPDQVITLPTDSASLDGRTSSDPDGMISAWHWTKISGPASLNIIHASDPGTRVKSLYSRFSHAINPFAVKPCRLPFIPPRSSNKKF